MRKASIAEATAISSRISHTVGAGSLDILHVALALVLDCDLFLSHDKRQLAVADTMKLETLALEAIE